HMIALCENAARAAKSSSTPRALFDAVIARLAMTERGADALADARAGAGAGVSGAGAGSRGPTPKKAPVPVAGDSGPPARAPALAGAASPGERPGGEGGGGVPCADTSDLWVALRESAPRGVKSILRVLTLKEQARDALVLEAGDPDTLNMARSALQRITEAA